MAASPVRRIVPLLLLALAATWIFGCTFVRQSISALRSTDHFIRNERDPRVLFEPGAEEHADTVVHFLPSAVRQVEDRQYRPFASLVEVYVCASRESYYRMYGMDNRAGVLTKLFLSPRLFEEPDETVKLYLTHELSHLHLQQQLGVFRMSRLPVWFKEGLAAYVSDGGGAQTVTEKQATGSIISGKHFVPDETGGFVFQKTASDWGLEHHMFYRQSMMFVRYLATANESGFRRLLLAVEDGERFSAALQAAYDKKLEELWGEFLHEVGERAGGH